MLPINFEKLYQYYVFTKSKEKQLQEKQKKKNW